MVLEVSFGAGRINTVQARACLLLAAFKTFFKLHTLKLVFLGPCATASSTSPPKVTWLRLQLMSGSNLDSHGFPRMASNSSSFVSITMKSSTSVKLLPIRYLVVRNSP